MSGEESEEEDTPPSEHSPPARRRTEREESDHSAERRADEDDTQPIGGSQPDQSGGGSNLSREGIQSVGHGQGASDDHNTTGGRNFELDGSRSNATTSRDESQQVDEHAVSAEGDVLPGTEQSEAGFPRDEVEPHSASAAQSPSAANEQVLQSTNGRFGPWSPDSNSTQAESSVARPATRSTRNLSRQLPKRPMASNSGTIPDDPDGTEPKRARQTTTEPAGPLEGAANPPEAFKFESTPSASRPPVEREPEYDVSHHTHCSGNPRDRCVDPTVGFRIPAYNKFDPPTGVVYADDSNRPSSGLSDDNVKFIISYCPCTKTEYLHDAWQQMLRAKPSNDRYSKYSLLSIRYSDKLNLLIRLYCPSRPQRPGEFIEID